MDLKEMSALTALNNMMEKGYLDICCIDSVGKLLGVKPDAHDSYTLLRPLHCIHFKQMPEPLREAIPSLVQDCLGVSPSFKFTTLKAQVIELQPESRPKGFLQRIGMSK
jgi:hypothetical protein